MKRSPKPTFLHNGLSRPARVGGARIETACGLKEERDERVAPPAWAGRGLKHMMPKRTASLILSPRPRGRGAD